MNLTSESIALLAFSNEETVAAWKKEVEKRKDREPVKCSNVSVVNRSVIENRDSLQFGNRRARTARATRSSTTSTTSARRSTTSTTSTTRSTTSTTSTTRSTASTTSTRVSTTSDSHRNVWAGGNNRTHCNLTTSTTSTTRSTTSTTSTTRSTTSTTRSTTSTTSTTRSTTSTTRSTTSTTSTTRSTTSTTSTTRPTTSSTTSATAATQRQHTGDTGCTPELDSYGIEHTTRWEENRQNHNNNSSDKRSEDTFWAGEKFVVKTVFDISSTSYSDSTLLKKVSINGTSYEATPQVTSTSGGKLVQTAALWKNDMSKTLRDGKITFTFEFNDGTKKQASVNIDNTVEYYRLHMNK